MLASVGVAVDVLTVQYGIARVQIQPLFAWHEGECEGEVGGEFLEVSCPSRIVARGLYAAGRRASAVKTDVSVSMP